MTKEVYSNEFINKTQSLFIKGIAIILMLFHHLFAYSERYPINSTIIFISDNLHYEQLIGQIGKYCVPIFLFISAYGFSKSSNSNTPNIYYVRKIVDFLINYWIVFVIFVPLSYLYSDWQYISLDLKTLFLNLFTLSSSYNGEWWFAFPYILLLMLTPLLHKSTSNLLSIAAISIICFSLSVNISVVQNFLYWQPAYIIGFIVGVHSNYLNKLIQTSLSIFIISILCICFIPIGFKYWGWDSMPFLTPFMIWIIMLSYNIFPKIIKKLIISLGKNSLFIWLVHSFFCYHFLKDFIYSPKHTVLIFLNLLIISYLTSLGLNIISNKFKKTLFKVLK